MHTCRYRCANGDIWNTLIGMSVQLCDTGPGDGGLCLLRGSHKLNFRVPDDMKHGEEGSGFHEHIHQPVTKAGDVLFFSEATVHGSLSWQAPHQRRLALFRFAPANFAYGRGYLDKWGFGELQSPEGEEKGEHSVGGAGEDIAAGEEIEEEVTEAEQAVMEVIRFHCMHLQSLSPSPTSALRRKSSHTKRTNTYMCVHLFLIYSPTRASVTLYGTA